MPTGVLPLEFIAKLPYQCPTSFRVLGVQIDSTLGCLDHYNQVSRKAGIRHGIMASLAQRKWGLEVGILRSAHSALLTSLVTYGLAATGGSMYESALGRLEAQQTNISARRITGVSRTARLAILHMVAGITTARNLYIQQCGIAIDRAVRTHNSRIKSATEEWLRRLYGTGEWGPAWCPLSTEDHIMTRIGHRDGDDETRLHQVPEQWAKSARHKRSRRTSSSKHSPHCS